MLSTRIHWLALLIVCDSWLVDEFVTSLLRKSMAWGLRLAQVPELMHHFNLRVSVQWQFSRNYDEQLHKLYHEINWDDGRHTFLRNPQYVDSNTNHNIMMKCRVTDKLHYQSSVYWGILFKLTSHLLQLKCFICYIDSYAVNGTHTWSDGFICVLRCIVG